MLSPAFPCQNERKTKLCEENTLRFQRMKKNQKRIYDVYIHAYVYIDRHVYVVHVYTSMQKKKEKNVYVCAWVDADVCTHMCKCLYMCTHTHK